MSIILIVANIANILAVAYGITKLCQFIKENRSLVWNYFKEDAYWLVPVIGFQIAFWLFVA